MTYSPYSSNYLSISSWLSNNNTFKELLESFRKLYTQIVLFTWKQKTKEKKVTWTEQTTNKKGNIYMEKTITFFYRSVYMKRTGIYKKCKYLSLSISPIQNTNKKYIKKNPEILYWNLLYRIVCSTVVYIDFYGAIYYYKKNIDCLLN